MQRREVMVNPMEAVIYKEPVEEATGEVTAVIVGVRDIAAVMLQ